MVIVVALVASLLWTPDRDRASLEALSLRSPADMVDVAGTRLDVRDSGPKDAPAVLLLHGFGASLYTWEDWAGPLSVDHRVIRLDLPGCGLSPPDPTGDYTGARSIAVLIALLDPLGVAKASVVGNSMGGRIAWTFAAEHPERVDRLVLISPDGFASPGFEYGVRPDGPATVKAMRYVLPKPLVKMRLAPTLLLWSEEDRMIPFRNAADDRKAIPGAKRVPLPGVGHLPQEEAP